MYITILIRTGWTLELQNGWIELFAADEVEKGSPQAYSWNGVSADGEMEVDLYPIPEVAERLRFNMTAPQQDLVVRWR